MLVVIDRGERCKFDAAGSARAPMLFGKRTEKERGPLLVGVEVIWKAKNAGGALELK